MHSEPVRVLSESQGRVLLREAFEASGFTIEENYLMQLGSSTVELDGFDLQARVGYEYVTREDGLQPGEAEELLTREDCVLFLIDERDVPDSATMLDAVWKFLRQLERRQ